MILMKFNSYRELIDYLNKDTFVDDENTEPINLFDLKLKGKIFSFGITSMNIRKGEIKYYYWLYETIKEQC